MNSDIVPNAPTEMGPRHADRKIVYKGDGFEIALIMLSNLILTILTLGIYHPWARTKLRRYVWEHVSFDGDRAAYVGTGLELFIGWLKLIGILFVGFGSLQLVRLLPTQLVVIVPILTIALYVLIFALARYSGLRYRLSRTMWRQIRFGVDKDKASTREFLKLFLKGAALTIVTIGFYRPYFSNEIRRFLTNRSRFGTAYFSFDGPSDAYFALCLKGFFLSLVTLGLYYPWMFRDMLAFRLEHTRFQNARFRYEGRGGQFLGFGLAAYFGTLFTLGLAVPWIYNWGLSLILNQVVVEGDIDFAQVRGVASDGSAFADELVSDYDIDLGF